MKFNSRKHPVLWVLTVYLFVFSSSVWLVAADYTLNFEGAVTGTDPIVKGSVPDGTSQSTYSFTHSIPVGSFGNVTLNSDWANWGAFYPGYYPNPTWSWNGGFALSNVSMEDTTNPRVSDGKANLNYVYDSYSGTTNTFAAVAGTTNYPEENFGMTVSGANGSSTYAVLLGASTLGTVGGTIRFENPVALKSLNFTNTAGALITDTYGSAFSSAIATGTGQWGAVIMRGLNADGILVGQKVLMLYDCILGHNSVVTSWNLANLAELTKQNYAAEYYQMSASDSDYLEIVDAVDSASASNDFSVLTDMNLIADFGSFADVTSLTFSFDGSDVGDYGLNFPTYFALDDLVFSYGSEPPVPPFGGEELPEPSAFLLLLAALPWGAAFLRKRTFF